MDLRSMMAALSAELADFASRLERLQEVPFLGDGSGSPLSGAALVEAMVAIQDLDRLAQDAAALSGFAARAACGATSEEALAQVSLLSLAERLKLHMTKAAPATPDQGG